MLVVLFAESGATFEVDISLSNSVSSLMDAMAAYARVPKDDQILLCDGVKLDASRTLESYKLVPESNILLFSKSSLQSDRPPDIAPLERIVVAAVAAPPSTRSGTSGGPTAALAEMERTFVYRKQQAEAFLAAAVRRRDQCNGLRNAQIVQTYALNEAVRNLNIHTERVNGACKSFAEHFNAQVEKRMELLRVFPDDIEATKKIRLHPAIATKDRQMLSDCIPEQRLVEWSRWCSESSGQLKRLVDDFMERTSILLRDAQEEIGRVNEYKDSDVVGQIEEIERIVASDQQVVVALTRDHARVVEILSTGGRVESSELARLNDMAQVHASQVAALQQNDVRLQELLTDLFTRKVNLTKYLHDRLRKISKLESSLEDKGAKVLTFLNADGEQAKNFKQLVFLHKLPAGYFAGLAEVVRRKAFKVSFLQHTSELVSILARVRQREVERRARFTKQYGQFLPANVIPGLDEVLGHVEIKTMAIEDQLPDINGEELVAEVGPLSQWLASSRVLNTSTSEMPSSVGTNTASQASVDWTGLLPSEEDWLPADVVTRLEVLNREVRELRQQLPASRPVVQPSVDVHALEQQLAQARTALAAMTSERDKLLTAQGNSVDAEVHRLRVEQAGLKSRLGELLEQVASTTRTCRALETEKATIVEQRSALERDNSVLVAEKGQLAGEVAVLKAANMEKSALVTDIQDVVRERDELKERVFRLGMSIAEREDKLLAAERASREATEQLTARQALWDSSREQMTQQLHQAEQECATLRQDLLNVQREMSEGLSQSQVISSERAHLVERMQAAESELVLRAKAAEELEAQMRTLKEQLIDAESQAKEVAELRAELEAAVAQRKELEANIERLDKALREAEAGNRDLKSKIVDLKTKCAGANAQNEANKQASDAFKRRLAQCETERDQGTRTLVQVRAEIDRADKEHAQAKANASALREQLALSQEQVTRLQADVARLQGDLSSRGGTDAAALDQLTTAKQALTQELARAHDDLAKQRQEVATANERLSSVESAYLESEERLQHMKQSTQLLHASIVGDRADGPSDRPHATMEALATEVTKLMVTSQEQTSKIAFRNFHPGEVALFFPTANADLWVAFSQGASPHYLSQASIDALKTSGAIPAEYLLVRIVHIEKTTITEQAPRFGLPAGTEYHEVTAEKLVV